MPPEKKRTLLVTSGDPAGISPELIPPLLQSINKKEKLVITGPEAVKREVCPRLKTSDDPLEENSSCWFAAGTVSSGLVSSGNTGKKTGAAALAALDAALQFINSETVDGLLTLPLAKDAVQEAGYPEFTGHTEYLKNFAGREGLMTFFGEKFNCGLITRHLPLRQVPDRLTTNTVVEKVKICQDFFEKSNNPSPRFALLGLNPHAGEEGSLGEEEINILNPAVKKLKNDGVDITGPHPADSFLPVHGEETDMIFSCYHDQGLTPFKQAHFYSGVHCTLGLGFYRASPVHGTAAALAGKNKVNPQSTLNCLRWLRRRTS